jgi:hypothetical protein
MSIALLKKAIKQYSKYFDDEYLEEMPNGKYRIFSKYKHLKAGQFYCDIKKFNKLDIKYLDMLFEIEFESLEKLYEEYKEIKKKPF